MEIIAFDTQTDALSNLGSVEGYVLRQGKIFECGDYPDKKFSLTPEEAQQAIAAFSPVGANLEHKNSILDGKLGTLIDVRMDSDGKSLFGTVWEPKWLSDLLPNTPRKVSLEWDKATKKIVGIGHVLNPAIPDAALFSAYAKFSSGEAVVPFAYESASERDAIPDEDFGDVANKLFPVRNQEECRQALNELAFADDPTAVKARIVAIAERKGLKIPDNDWMQTRGVSKPLDNDNEYAMYSQNSQEQDMSNELQGKVFIQREPGIMRQATPEDVVAFTGGKVTVEAKAPEAATMPSEPAKTPREIELEAEIAKFNAEKEAEHLQGIASSAEKAADELVEKGVIEAKGNDAYVQTKAFFTGLLHLDAQAQSAPLACFSNESPMPNGLRFFEKAKELFKDARTHDGKERVSNQDPTTLGAVAMFGQDKTTAADPATGEIRQLSLKAAEEILKNRNGTAAGAT